MKRDKFVGIAPDDDNDIRIIEDISSVRVAGADSGDLWSELRSLLRDVLSPPLSPSWLWVLSCNRCESRGRALMPKLHDQDRIFVNKFIYPLRECIGDSEPIKRGDIVVLLYPDDPSKSYIKRVAGLPGEEVNVDNGKLYINGAQIDEPYLDSEYLSSDSMPGPVRVKDHHYFVLGDNRRNSSDSRYWGLVPRKIHLRQGHLPLLPVHACRANRRDRITMLVNLSLLFGLLWRPMTAIQRARDRAPVAFAVFAAWLMVFLYWGVAVALNSYAPGGSWSIGDEFESSFQALSGVLASAARMAVMVVLFVAVVYTPFAIRSPISLSGGRVFRW